MTPKEKSKELFNKYCYAIRTEETDSAYWTNIIYAKQCALIAVDLILDETIYYFNDDDIFIEYWQEVKQEINKL
jgi:hypothetical protein